MKKYLSLAVAALLAAGALAANVSAAPGTKSWGDVPKTSDKLVLDGKPDAVYKEGLKVDISTIREDGKKDTAKGTGYYLWDGEYIWACVEVTDSELIKNDVTLQTGKYWNCDGIEIMYDFANDTKSLSKWTVWYEGDFTAKADTSVTDSETKTTYTDKGYTVEVRTKLPDGVKEGSLIGVNLLIDNMTADGRVVVRAPQSANATENELAKYDTITLSDKTVAAKKTNTAAATADPIVLAALSLAAAAGIAVSRKRK